MQCGCSIIQRLSCQVSLSRNASKNIKWAPKWLWNSCGISVCFKCKRELANLFGALKKSGSVWVYYSVHVCGLYEILLVKQKKRITKENNLDLLHSVSTYWANEYTCIRRLWDFYIQYSFTHKKWTQSQTFYIIN